MPAKPVVIWAGLGAAFLSLTVYVFGAWMLSPDFKRIYPSAPLSETAQSLVLWNPVLFSLVTIFCLAYGADPMSNKYS